MHIPTTAIAAEKLDINDRTWKIVIIGAGGTGKTTTALKTFPNPILIDYDNKYGQHIGSNFLLLPFWNQQWLTERYKGVVYKNAERGGIATPSGVQATVKFLADEGPKLSSKQTVVFDTWTFFQQILDEELHRTPVINKHGVVDPREFWGRKLKLSKEVQTLLRQLPCNVIVNCHETREVNDDGISTGFFLPLQQGSFQNQLKEGFQDYFRQIAKTRKAVNDEDKKDKEWQVYNKVTNEVTQFLWQVRADTTFMPLSSIQFKDELLIEGKYVPASYKSLIA